MEEKSEVRESMTHGDIVNYPANRFKDDPDPCKVFVQHKLFQKNPGTLIFDGKSLSVFEENKMMNDALFVKDEYGEFKRLLNYPSSHNMDLDHHIDSSREWEKIGFSRWVVEEDRTINIRKRKVV